jgi:hypothetical protein
MRFFLRDIKNGHFLKSHGDWTDSREKAQKFGSMEEAIAKAETLEKRDLEVFFESGGIRLPVPTPAGQQIAFKETSS